LNGAVSKTVRGLRVPRGFESHPLRSKAQDALVKAVQVGEIRPHAQFRRDATEGFHREVREALAGTVWTGCGNWYLDANGNTPKQWPWRWMTYARRTHRLEYGRLRVRCFR
jgi:hypothetical protein